MAPLERAVRSTKDQEISPNQILPIENRRYIPARLVRRKFHFSELLQSSISQSELALVEMNAGCASKQEIEAMTRSMIRAESIASSRIAGQALVTRRILRAELEMNLVGDTLDQCANEVLSNIHALSYGICQIREGSEITIDLISKIHELITSAKNDAGCFALPFSPDLDELMADLILFCNRDDLPAVAQAAIAQAQLETIRPFAEGNGRTARVLAQLILRRRGLALKVLPPVSLVVANQMKQFKTGHSSNQNVGKCKSTPASSNLNSWIEIFSYSCNKSIAEAMQFQRQLALIERGWRKKLGYVRDDCTIDLLLQRLTGVPVLSVTSAMKIINRNLPVTSAALSLLVSNGILTEINLSARNRAFEAPEIITAFTKMEKTLVN